LRDTAYRSRVLLSDRLHFNPSEPDLRVFDFDRDLPARERDELPGILRIGLLKPRASGNALDEGSGPARRTSSSVGPFTSSMISAREWLAASTP